MDQIKLVRKSAKGKAVSTPPALADSYKFRGRKWTPGELLDMLVGLCESYGRPDYFPRRC